ncbi:C-signal-like [Paramisgurnus dabryanus]|uniref:C-signal-like n=1 Tax=Paramisgurnus dabryanus TaxID=90735 RepID=UPI003CCF0E7E
MLNFSKCHSILITGASRGLGLEMVRQLLSTPERPKKNHRNRCRGTELQALAKSHPEVHVVTLDVTSDVSVNDAVQEVKSIVGADGLNCLINNAAINIHCDLDTVTRDVMMKTYEINTVAPLFVTKAFLPLLREAAGQGSGMGIHRSAVINVSSILGSVQLNWGEMGAPKLYAYRPSKSALNMITRSLAVDLEAEGILCVALHPGWVRTDLGGADADMSVEESISSVLPVICGLTEKDHGGFVSYNGETLPW